MEIKGKVHCFICDNILGVEQEGVMQQLEINFKGEDE